MGEEEKRNKEGRKTEVIKASKVTIFICANSKWSRTKVWWDSRRGVHMGTVMIWAPSWPRQCFTSIVWYLIICNTKNKHSPAGDTIPRVRLTIDMASRNNPQYPRPPYWWGHRLAGASALHNGVSPALSSVLANPPGCVTKGWSLGAQKARPGLSQSERVKFSHLSGSSSPSRPPKETPRPSLRLSQAPEPPETVSVRVFLLTLRPLCCVCGWKYVFIIRSLKCVFPSFHLNENVLVPKYMPFI